MTIILGFSLIMIGFGLYVIRKKELGPEEGNRGDHIKGIPAVTIGIIMVMSGLYCIMSIMSIMTL